MISYRNVERRRVDALRQKAEIAGFDMPVAVTAAIKVETGLRDDLIKTREEMAHIPTASDLVGILRGHGGLPPNFGKTLHGWQQQTLTLREQERLLSIAVEEQEEAVYSITIRESDAMIRTQLQPRLAEIIKEAKQHVEQYDGIPWGDFDRAMALADPDKKAAYLAVRDAAVRFGGIKDAMRLLYDGRPYELRHQIRNLREIWPNQAFRGPGTKQPWPNEQVEQLAWLVGHGADLWAPTPDEADIEEAKQVAAARAARRPLGRDVEVVRQ